MGLTKAEKHNRMLDRVFDNYNKHQKSLPSTHLYSRYLDIAVEKLNISRDDARNKYGLYTVEQWEKLLNLGWNKS
jgi:hypothetical protein